jgi:hypothetical protein
MSFDQAIEGAYLQTKEDNLFFDIKGIFHPKDRVISFIRFYPDPEGDRIRKGIQYRKIYDISERYSFLKQHFPEYIFYSKHLDMELQGVKRKDIKKIYTPRECYKNLEGKKRMSKRELKAIELCNLFIEKGEVPESSIGITGSQMVGLNTEKSDIDLIIYGTKVAKNFQKKLISIFQDINECRKYNFEEYKKHYRFRAAGAGISFNDFMKSEIRKNHQGKYHDIDFFIRYIKSPEDWKGNYYDYHFTNLGRIKLSAEIINSSDSLFTPCSYLINPLRIINEKDLSKNIEMDKLKEINSYRGRFCEHAKEEEIVLVEGKLEKVNYKNEEIYYRILLGNQKQDKMILL